MNTNNTDTVTLFVKLFVKSESNAKARQALLADVHGAWSEEGNYKMELYDAAEKPNVLYLFERWKNQAALENHFKQPYTVGAFDLQKADLVKPIEMNYLTDLWPLVNETLKKEEHRALTTLIVPFEVKPGNGPQIIELFEKFVPLVRQEQGNVEFSFHSVKGSDNLFVLYERWENQQNLEAHNKLETTGELVDSVGKLINGTVLGSVLFVTDISK
ncbi:putative quinol monooxygenase [Flavobacterium procerum]|uniref:Quinol monooxygenase n=1 Tax=Flavobacterium procerum TaxID=1455569 RepID=A0ABV6BWN1_9FLAO